MYVLGIDGGGTKTIGILSDVKGNIIGKHTVGATNPNSVGRDKVKDEVTSLIKTLLANTGGTVSTVFAGMSGVGAKENHTWMTGILKALLPTETDITLDIDGVNALYSGSLGKPGIVNIAGTGALTFGINEAGDRGRVGGWGYLIDEAGSGFTIGRAALQSIFDSWDGIGPETALTQLVLDRYSVASAPELISYIYEPEKAREVIAPISELVFQAADANDSVAIAILNKSANKIAENIGVLITKLFLNTPRSNSVPIVLTGGIFNRSEWFIPVIEKALMNHQVKTKLILPQVSPAAGALAAALLKAGSKVDEGIIKSWINARI